MNTTTQPKTIYADQSRIVLLVAASFIILAGAWGLEILGPYPPCDLCLKQRWAYYFTIAAGLIALGVYRSSYKTLAMIILGLIALAFLANTVLGIYHAGIEWKFWSGPAACSGNADLGADSKSILEQLNSKPFVSCSEAQFRIFWLSLAGYSAIFSAILSGLAAWTASTLKS